MSGLAAFPIAIGAREPSVVRFAAGLSFVLHAALLTALAASPVRPALSDDALSRSEQQIEIHAVPEPTPAPEPEVDSDMPGGNGLPLERPVNPPAEVLEPSLEEPEPPVRSAPPEDVSQGVADEEVLSVEDASSESEFDKTSNVESEKSEHAGAEGGPAGAENGAPGGRGEGSGAGRGGAKSVPVFDFFRTFLETLPQAGKYDPSWASLPRGPLGRVTFRVTLEEGRLLPIVIVPQPGTPAPAALRQIVARTERLLRERRFLLHPGVSSTTRVFVVDASIDGRTRHDETPNKPGVRELGLLGVPLQNGAYFTYHSGQQVNLFMYQQAGR